MRAKVALLLAGVVFGSVGTAVGAPIMWHRAHGPYACFGIESAVECHRNGSPWSVLVGKSGVAIMNEDTGGPVFACKPLQRPARCFDFR